MKRLFSSIAIAMVALSLGGCAGTDLGNKIGAIWSTVAKAQSLKIERKYLLTAIASADGVIVIGRNYIDPRRNKRCDGPGGSMMGASNPVCRDANVTPIVHKVVQAVRTSRNNAKAYLRANAGAEEVDISVYDALKLSIQTAQDVYSQYNIGSR